jgi:hypothetical protein
MVVTVLIYACFTFYKHYVLPAKSLAATLKWIRETVTTMKEASPETRKNALQKVFKGSFLQDNWQDFSQTLHEQKALVGGEYRLVRHRSTVPANHFFTAATVIDKPLKVNYFKHLPGILTGVGIIGTFAGLLFGLSNFDASSPEVINLSVSLLLAGVRDAFYASAFAITAAMVVTHVEKLFYQRCLTNLEDLNDVISSMFEGGVTEEYLAQMSSTALDPAQQVKQMSETIVKAFEPLVAAMERNQMSLSRSITDAITEALNSSHNKLASQIENSLQRKSKEPIESLGKQMLLLRSSKSGESQQDLMKKIIRAQGKATTDEKPSEAA